MLEIIPARPSTAMYGKSLAETTAVKDWAARRFGMRTIPASDLRGVGAPWPVNPLGEQTGVKDWAMRRIDKASLPASSLRGLGAPWPVNPLGEQTGVKDWAMRRIDKASLPASSLRGLGAPWRINPLGEQTAVKDWAMRRIDKRSLPASSLRGLNETTYVFNVGDRRAGKTLAYEQESALMGFGALDGSVPTREVQSTLRKLLYCTGADGRPLAVDGEFGPNTEFALSRLVSATAGGSQVQSGQLFAAAAGDSSVRVDMSWWSTIAASAAGRTDTCATRSGGGGSSNTGGSGGASSSGAAPPPAPAEESSWMTSPWTWLGIAAVAGIGFYAWQNRDDSSL